MVSLFSKLSFTHRFTHKAIFLIPSRYDRLDDDVGKTAFVTNFTENRSVYISNVIFGIATTTSMDEQNESKSNTCS